MGGFKVKLLFYIGSLERGGAERVISNLCNEMTKRGHDVILVTTYAKYDYIIPKNVKKIVLKTSKNKVISNFGRIIELRQICKSENPDVAISFMREPNFRLLISNIFNKQKIIISIRNDPKKEYQRGFMILSKFLFRRANGVIFQTEDAKNFFDKCKLKNPSVILNPIDAKFFLNSVIMPQERKNIVSVGRLEEQKNQELLIRAYYNIQNDICDNLLIYGSGSLYNKLNKIIKDLKLENRVFLKGSNENIKNEIKNAKVFVLTSNYEGLPNCLMEAMALGIPTISTNCPCGGPKMLLSDNAGILIDVNDIKMLSKSLKKLLNDIKLIEFYSEKSKEKSKTFYPAHIYDQWEKYFIKICEEN